jgi:hypothetical protein
MILYVGILQANYACTVCTSRFVARKSIGRDELPRLQRSQRLVHCIGWDPSPVDWNQSFVSLAFSSFSTKIVLLKTIDDAMDGDQSFVYLDISHLSIPGMGGGGRWHPSLDGNPSFCRQLFIFP